MLRIARGDPTSPRKRGEVKSSHREASRVEVKLDCFVALLLAMTGPHLNRRYGRKACRTRSTTCLRRARLAAALDRSLPKIADSVGVLEKKK